MRGTIRITYVRDHPSARIQVRADHAELLLHMLVQLFLLSHVKGRQPVVRHEHDIDISRIDATLRA